MPLRRAGIPSLYFGLCSESINTHFTCLFCEKRRKIFFQN
ncbi:hypothetical protein T4B_12173 [Trichinella pseudospiralis]|uniref:Uncharacterized protein n=1 Tax=Trichinella pseudospiralis TaxID=6337 RepID=A0A0V1G9H0_TRIPS|nr:hypothetical protein T4B_12173 [Trichinella pseudospiralis]